MILQLFKEFLVCYFVAGFWYWKYRLH